MHASLQPLLSYIDPVSGVIVLQIIIAGAVGAIAFFRRSLWRVLSLFTGRKASGDESADQEPNEEPSEKS